MRFTEYEPEAITAWCADNDIDPQRVLTSDFSVSEWPDGTAWAKYRYFSLNDEGSPYLRQPSDIELAREGWWIERVCCVPTLTGHHQPVCVKNPEVSA